MTYTIYFLFKPYVQYQKENIHSFNKLKLINCRMILFDLNYNNSSYKVDKWQNSRAKHEKLLIFFVTLKHTFYFIFIVKLNTL